MTDLNKPTNYEAEKLKIAKDGLSRILAQVKDDDRTWAMISAYRNENSQEENNRQTMLLTSDLAHTHLDAIKIEGGYVEPVTDEDVVNDVPTKERCFFVGNITKEQAMELCAKYNQDTVLFRDKDGLRYIDRNGNDKSEIFSTATVDDNYALKQIKDYFSELYPKKWTMEI